VIRIRTALDTFHR